MARKLDVTQIRELQAFVAGLKALGGYTVSAEWARDSGYPAPNLSKLENGVGSIDGYNLLRLIRAAAHRGGVEPTDAAALAAVSRGWNASDREAVAVALEELAGQAAAQRSLLDRLVRLVGGPGHAGSGGR